MNFKLFFFTVEKVNRMSQNVPTRIVKPEITYRDQPTVPTKEMG